MQKRHKCRKAEATTFLPCFFFAHSLPCTHWRGDRCDLENGNAGDILMGKAFFVQTGGGQFSVAITRGFFFPAFQMSIFRRRSVRSLNKHSAHLRIRGGGKDFVAHHSHDRTLFFSFGAHLLPLWICQESVPLALTFGKIRLFKHKSLRSL